MTRLNTRVIVSPYDTAPVGIAHPALFQPRLTARSPAPTAPVPAMEVPAQQSRPAPTFKQDDAAAAPDTPMMLGARLPKPAAPEAVAPQAAAQKAVLTPMERARALKAATQQKAAQAVKAADEAKLIHKARLGEVQKAQRDIKAVDVAEKRAAARVGSAGKAVSLARTEEAAEKARLAHVKALEELVAATSVATEARSGLEAKTEAVRDAEAAARAAEAARKAALVEAREAARKTEPISVFVSRRTGRLYVRQALQPVFDVPVTIKDAGRPIGTTVFTAVEATNGGTGLAWTAVSVEAPSGGARKAVSKGKGAPRPPLPSARDVASQTLDRIEFPPEALERITEYLQVGSSLIVSDHPISRETGKGTDFVVLTRDTQ
jgi:hypothetical protein